MEDTITIKVEDIVKKISEINQEYQINSLKETTVEYVSNKSYEIGRLEILSWILQQK